MFALPDLNTRGVGRIRHSYAITVENSPNHSSVYIRLCKYRKKVFNCYYKKRSREKTQNSLFRAMIKREILTSHEVLYTKLVRVISSCFAIKMLSKNKGFSHLKCKLKRKKIDTARFWRFSKFQPARKWVNKVNMSSFQLKKVFQISACVISARKAKHLDATTMFTYSHANTPLGQSERAYCLSYFINACIPPSAWWRH